MACRLTAAGVAGGDIAHVLCVAGADFAEDDISDAALACKISVKHGHRCGQDIQKAPCEAAPPRP